MTILTGARDISGERTVDGVRIISIDLFGVMRRTWNGYNLTLARQVLFPLVVIFNMYRSSSGNGARDLIKGSDVCHGHIYASGLVANYLARGSGAVAVNTIHGSYYPVWNKLTNSFAATFYRAAERILAPALARMSDLQIHTGDYFAKQVLAWGADKGKVRTILNGADLDTFSPWVPPVACPDGKDRNGIPLIGDRSVPVIMTARRLVKKNGIDYLIKAMSHVLEKDTCQLVIIGDGEERPALEELAGELDISENVHFLGMIPHKELPPYLSLADIAVVPSLIEASSIFMLEAMAMAKPVIATNTGGLPEVLDQSTGVLVEPADELALSDAILGLIRNRDLRLQLGQSARRRMEDEYTWKAVARKTELEYARLITDAKEG